ncbi:hypothetical protein AVEN_253176-1 [Araneus ventricosus]|uniref:Uncharacterized protein n=1 Tax=Araneus ventricosus TaxID=182803 RepID=A0A4Y2P0C0_ARAVE|nr:hypothetical protein AVEN_253176-1 [Araneus ventricosus]
MVVLQLNKSAFVPVAVRCQPVSFQSKDGHCSRKMHQMEWKQTRKFGLFCEIDHLRFPISSSRPKHGLQAKLPREASVNSNRNRPTSRKMEEQDGI